MNKEKMYRFNRINSQRATHNLNKLIKTKDVVLFKLMEKARCKWWAKNMRMFYNK